MTTQDDYLTALSFWTLAVEYICLVENVAQETVKQGNPWGVVSDYVEGHEGFEQDYHARTKWSDRNIITPILFDLYHIIELLLKGFLVVHPEGEVQAQHGLEGLCRRFEELFPDETKIHCFLHKYTQRDKMPSLLRDFLQDNNISVGQLYEAFRYPTDRNFEQLRRYTKLKYKGADGVQFFLELNDDLAEVRRESVRLGRTFEPKEGNGQQDLASD